MFYPINVAQLVRAEYERDPAEDRAPQCRRDQRHHPVRRAYARLWWAVRPRFATHRVAL